LTQPLARESSIRKFVDFRSRLNVPNIPCPCRWSVGRSLFVSDPQLKTLIERRSAGCFSTGQVQHSQVRVYSITGLLFTHLNTSYQRNYTGLYAGSADDFDAVCLLIDTCNYVFLNFRSLTWVVDRPPMHVYGRVSNIYVSLRDNNICVSAGRYTGRLSGHPFIFFEYVSFVWRQNQHRLSPICEIRSSPVVDTLIQIT